ncbi:GYD domain-containing protein [Anaeromyxobacter sp. Fw109-5]|uniref:GYD domain-containing protein n=1 Tax=Anaeromyxobacter sp. (strain Fw109-5) TaxID=404589 RepID=UPI0000ED7AE4|nr:GYD domain-containing protein [Anaeromyxobacter sp. Fw109-5]ABS28681.1 GYD family protein [Anaeromyxobacter sp. Fw109-5]
MASYLVLFGFTPQGVQHIKDCPARVAAAKETVRSLGGEVRAFYGIMGSAHDTLFIVDAPDDAAMARMVLAIAEKGFVRTETHRLFTEDEFGEIVRSLP